ncbi:MAG: D-ribose pyranase [Oscillospiraceae bacterium]|nr:D-ribose pyranase [Oscillospiraceae bacterium]MBR2805535.1 D-ribose pyranase [Oscillospiraceae bacterium]
MKKDRLLNKEIIAEVAALGHTEYFVICDCGLPIPKGVKVIDISIKAGNPKFLDVLDAVDDELVVESIILASEIDEKSPALAKEMEARFPLSVTKKVPHEEFKELTKNAKCIVRTGETTSYANVILIGGVNF